MRKSTSNNGVFWILLILSHLIQIQSSAQTQVADSLLLHVPSPHWEDQIIYFLMTDRFNDGDTSNNDQGYNEFDPSDSGKYSGGDIQGIIDKLDYIQNLGATAVWISPPVANQWWDGMNQVSGYHGYWAENFKEVDKHLGTLLDYQQLSHHIHKRGMYLIQDIVINHTGNFYVHKGVYNENKQEETFDFNELSLPMKTPSQFPFNLNDVRIPGHKEANIYHWTPGVNDFNDKYQMLYYEMGELDDINTKNAVVREIFRNSYGYWVRIVGVDGFRIDTVIYVEKDYWNDFLYALSSENPGIDHVARTTGRDDFITFGETFINSKPFTKDGDKEISSYTGTPEEPGMNSMLNFPLCFTTNRVFAQGKPTNYMSYRLNAIYKDTIYRNPEKLINFIDNHDLNRYLSNASVESLKQALFFQFSIPGIPAIYMGTEQLFKETRASMFAGGWGSEENGSFDEHSEMFLFIKQLAELRKNNKVLTRGNLTVIRDSENGPGVLAFIRKYEDDEIVVIFNTAEESILLSNLETKLPYGTKLDLLFGMNFNDHIEVGENGKLSMELAPRASVIFRAQHKFGPLEKQNLLPDSPGEIETDIAGQIYTKDIHLEGSLNDGNEGCVLVVNGKLKNKIPVIPDTENKWECNLPISSFSFGRSSNEICIYCPKTSTSSPSIDFITDISIQGNVTITTDASQDDNGPLNNYILPGDKSFGDQMDIREVKTTTFGGNLLLEITMGEVTDIWLPPNGFDHVVFNVFIDLPDTSGSDYAPMINSNMPDDFTWNYAAIIGGWNSRYFSSKGSDRFHFGEKISISPDIQVDKKNNKITFKFPPDALGDQKSWQGAKIYITTWDSNGGESAYRLISKDGGRWKFGGSNDPRPVLILDDTSIINLK